MKCLVHHLGLIILPVLLRPELANKIHCLDTFPSTRQSQPMSSVSLAKGVQSHNSSGALLGSGPACSEVSSPWNSMYFDRHIPLFYTPNPLTLQQRCVGFSFSLYLYSLSRVTSFQPRVHTSDIWLINQASSMTSVYLCHNSLKHTL